MSTPTENALAFPLLGKTPCLDYESEGFRAMDLATDGPIPMAGRGHPGAFGHERANHTHEGVDLYGQEGDVVVAMFDGVVVFNGPFTGNEAGSPWWLSTGAIAIEGAHGVLFHGEINALPLAVGSRVSAGDPLGTISRVLRKDKGRPLHMLHLEFYEHGIYESIGIWAAGSPRPLGLLDPTELILASANLEMPQAPTPPKPSA